MQHLLSVVIAIKDNTAALIKTLASLAELDKCNASFEVLVINGGSALMKEEIAQQPYSITIVDEVDEGIYDAWNKGLGLAEGEFVAFLGAGDCVRPNYFKEMYELSAKYMDSDLLLCRQLQWMPNGRVLREFGRHWNWNAFQRNFTIPHIGCWHKRKLFQTFGNFDIHYKVCGDYEWLLRVGAQLRVEYTPAVLLDVPVGGVSDSNEQVFKETRLARKTHTRASSVNLIYHDVAYRARKSIRKLFWG